MARIRTIKPEFPQSETMGRVSRDARLLFIQIWTICDDAGRCRGNSRVLASLLYPYDDDARDLLSGWLDALEDVGAIRRYVVGGDTFLEVCNWLKHQKIDKPSGPKCPPFAEGSPYVREGVANPPRGTGTGTPTTTGTPTGRGAYDAAAPRRARKPRKSEAGEEPPEFAELRAVYPKRAGDQRWPEALAHARTRLEEGHTWAEMLAGATRYAAFIRAKGDERTEYVKQAASFIGTGKSKPFLDSWDLPALRPASGKPAPLSAVDRVRQATGVDLRKTLAPTVDVPALPGRLGSG